MSKPSLPILTLLLAGGLFTSGIVHAATAPNPEQVLKAMSSKLAGAKQIRFKAERQVDAALSAGGLLPEKARIEVNVARPNRLKGHSVSRERTMEFIADGRTLTIYNQTKNHYAQVPMRTSIDGLVDRLDAEYGFVPPLADFAVSNPYKELRGQARSISYVGREKVGGKLFGLGGVSCERLELKGRRADASLWIGEADHLPYRMVVTLHGASRPQLLIAFAEWNLNAPAADFTFRPAAGTQKIEMWTTARMNAARKH